MELAGKVAVVTGSGNGIGEAMPDGAKLCEVVAIFCVKLGEGEGGFAADQLARDIVNRNHQPMVHQPRAGVVRAQSRKHEDARTYNCTYSQRSKLERSEGSLQAVVTRFPSLCKKHVHRLSSPEIRHS